MFLADCDPGKLYEIIGELHATHAVAVARLLCCRGSSNMFNCVLLLKINIITIRREREGANKRKVNGILIAHHTYLRLLLSLVHSVQFSGIAAAAAHVCTLSQLILV